jgi:hypothetical protein
MTIVAGNGDPYEFRIFDSMGRLTRLVRVAGADAPISEEEMEVAVASWAQSTAAFLSEQEANLAVKSMPQQVHYPAYRNIVVDRLGEIWVETWTRGWDVFNRNGRWLGSLELPGTPLDIGRDYVIVTSTDTTGVEILQLHDLFRGR